MKCGLTLVAAVLLSACGKGSGTEDLERVRERLERAMPRDRGLEAVPQVAPERRAIRAAVKRLDADDDDAKARTEVEIAGDAFVLEPGDEGLAHERREEVWARVRDRIAALRVRSPGSRGEIAERLVVGRHPVPHRHVMRVLDAFLTAGISDVNFVGASADPAPLTR